MRKECAILNVTHLELKYDASYFETNNPVSFLFEPFCFSRKSYKLLPETLFEKEEDFNVTTFTFDRLEARYYEYRVASYIWNYDVNIGHASSQTFFEVSFKKMTELTAFLISGRHHHVQYSSFGQFFIKQTSHDQWLPVRHKDGEIIVTFF